MLVVPKLEQLTPPLDLPVLDLDPFFPALLSALIYAYLFVFNCFLSEPGIPIPDPLKAAFSIVLFEVIDAVVLNDMP